MIPALTRDNLPTPKDERWKYTNLPAALGVDLVSVAPQPEEVRVIHSACGQNGGQVEDILWMGEDGQQQRPRMEIVVEDGASLTVIERHGGQGRYWKNMATDITVGANARLIHIRLQEDSLDAVQTNMTTLSMARDSHYDGFTLNLGGLLTRQEVAAELNGSGIECHLRGANLLRGTQHSDTTIVIAHRAPHCSSYQDFRTVLDDRARGVFQGKIYVDQIAQKTDGYQLSKALMLSDGAEMDTKPELEIYADDVKCSHGALSGKLDEEPLFYMRSRGIPEEAARSLLIQSFISEVVDKIGDNTMHMVVEEKVRAWLA
ncbi:MAG: Fe-S cluster assembly protein SufD [Rhodospirillales bacterium]|nr:Fe-S cluster assembly protein SufD [Rhodospirillales bacterium]MCB9980726.1 Fe-S cluster assembly protein SufD [Rhodospirillales bacterium]